MKTAGEEISEVTLALSNIFIICRGKKESCNAPSLPDFNSDFELWVPTLTHDSWKFGTQERFRDHLTVP